MQSREPTLSGFGPQKSEVMRLDPALSEIAVVAILPLNVAVSVAVWSLAILPARAVNVAEALPAPNVTEVGTVKAAASLDNLTVASPAFDKVTAQVAPPPGPKLEGVQLSPLTVTGATSATAAVWALPLSDAVRMAV